MYDENLYHSDTVHDGMPGMSYDCIALCASVRVFWMLIVAHIHIAKEVTIDFVASNKPIDSLHMSHQK